MTEIYAYLDGGCKYRMFKKIDIMNKRELNISERVSKLGKCRDRVNDTSDFEYGRNWQSSSIIDRLQFSNLDTYAQSLILSHVNNLRV